MSTMEQKQPRAAVYPRVSSKQQADNYSLDTQLAACIAHAERLGYVVPETQIYREVHTGVDFWERPQMTALRNAIRTGEIEAVVFYSVDRYARDPLFHMLGLAEARQYGVKFHIVTDDLDLSDDDDVLMFFLRGYSAKREWKDLRERVIRGRRARAGEGKLLSRPKPLYGYRFKDEDRGSYAVNDDEAQVVRRIVDECLAGTSINRIRLGLNADGIPSPSGLDYWSHSTIHRILTTQDYTGCGAAWCGEFALAKDVIPAIITEDEHSTIQDRLKHNKQYSARNTLKPEDALLRSGFIRCGYCGRVVQTAKSHGKPSYRCRGHNDHSRGMPRACPGAWIFADELDAAVWGRIMALLADPTVIEDELERRMQDDPTTANLAAIDRTMREVERKQRNVTTAIPMVTNDDALTPLVRQLEEYASRLAELRAERERIMCQRHDWERARRQIGDVRAWCVTVARRAKRLDWAEKRDILAVLQAEVTLYNAAHTPRYELKTIIPLDATLSHTIYREANRPDANAC